MERRIVICAPTGRDGALTAKVLQSVGIHSIVCANSDELMQQLPLGAGAVLLVEEVVSGSGMRPLAEYVATQPTWSDIPILLLTRSGADSLDVQRAVEHLGNVTLVERPVRTIALITATRSAVRARERQYQVRDADKRKDEFLATLAHELRNPLAPIRTSMGILKHLYPESGQITQVRNVVDRQVSHLTRLVDDLLDVARITSGKVTLKKGEITLQSVVNHAVEISGSAMESKQHRLEVQEPDTPYLLDADHARLVQSVANLLVNAAKFTPPGGHIVLRAEVEGPVVTFRVTDNGIGLEPASLAKIFDLFVQTPVPGEAPTGLGIGLSLARQFAGMHGGTIHATSEGLGRGSEFVLTLPVVLQAVPPALELPVPVAAPALQGNAKKILIVDDNVDAANTLAALLGMDGFAVTTAYDGVAAVAAAQAGTPDVVVMDIGMPGMNGYDAARLMRQQPHSDKMVLVALTGWGQSTDKTLAAQAGFNHHLVKPVDYESLMSCLVA
ncbi:MULTISPECIES: response regulator [unclassified Polaromonas]|uniref:response regulator n=1 Tax=unclassified Polaromonas TaxID=2638319 RepID=UPI000F07B026|nr:MULTISPECIES: response regulator [unclassified Polaromonas]AYQ28343.1 hybrid sensor histidine kinase/response regulator [Polaromonas sp. SP1]QGJ20535.1 response regulator [Polaromonas sp. Pch-P]